EPSPSRWTIRGGGGTLVRRRPWRAERRSRMRVRTLAVLVVALALASPLSAAPRYRRRPPPGGYGPVDREGFLIGFSVGAGGVWPDPCTDCGVAPGAEIHLGAMASPYGDVAVMLEAGGLARDDIHHGFLVAAAQW